MDIFFPEQGESAIHGKKFCRECPVRTECAEYSIRTNSQGIFGGIVFGFKD